MTLSIIIPVYNEENTIEIVLSSLLKLQIPQTKIEVIVVDDGSTDNTANKIHNFQKLHQEITLIKNQKNIGKGSTVIAGIKKATGSYIIIQDADLEYDPKQIEKLYLALDNRTRVIYGTRLARLPHLTNEESRIRFLVHYLGNRLLSLLTSILYGQWITDMETCYKLIPRDAFEKITIHARGFEFEPEITAKLLKNGYKIHEVAITTKPRGYDEGKKLNTIRDGVKALMAIIKYRFVN